MQGQVLLQVRQEDVNYTVLPWPTPRMWGGPVWSAVCPALNRQREAGVDGTGKSGWEQSGHGQWFGVISNREMKLFSRVF